MLDKLKNILKGDSEKAIIVEEGEPRYVVMSFDEYRRITGNEEGAEVDGVENLDHDMSSDDSYYTPVDDSTPGDDGDEDDFIDLSEIEPPEYEPAETEEVSSGINIGDLPM